VMVDVGCPNDNVKLGVSIHEDEKVAGTDRSADPPIEMHDYETKFVLEGKSRGRGGHHGKTRKLHVMYLYERIGYVPTGVEFSFRGKRYGTIPVMELLASADPRAPAGPGALPRFRPADWFEFDAAKFRNLQRFLEREASSKKRLEACG